MAVSTLLVISSAGLARWQNSTIGKHSAPARAEENYKQELLKLENRWLEAEDDPVTLESILAADFLHVLPGGIITKDEQLAYMRKHPAPKTQPAKQFENMHIRIYGTVGIVNGIVRATETGKIHRTLFTDVFVRQNGRWEAVSAQELPAADQTH